MKLSDIIKNIAGYGYIIVWIICLLIIVFYDLTKKQTVAILIFAILPITAIIVYIIGAIITLFE